MNSRELVITAMIKGSISQLQHVKEVLDNLQEFPLDNDKLKLIEDAIWCICDARDDLKAIIQTTGVKDKITNDDVIPIDKPINKKELKDLNNMFNYG